MLLAVEVLQPVVAAAEAQGIKMVMHVKPKAEDGSAQVKELITAIQADQDTKDVTVGSLVKDKHNGKFVEVYNATMAEGGLQIVDVAPGLADLLSVKDANEVLNHKKAAMLASRVLKDFVVGQIEVVLDAGKSVRHSKLTEQTEAAIVDPSKVRV